MIRAIEQVENPPLTMSVVTDAAELESLRAQMVRLALNSAWLQARAAEVYSRHRGKYIAIAGQELFVADTVQAAMALAQAAHPTDDGVLTQYIPRRSGARIYAHRRFLAGL